MFSDSINSNLSMEVIKENHKPIDYLLLDPPSQRHYTEPWHIRYLGGLTVALHKLLPFKGGYLYLDLAPDVPTSKVIRSRSYSVSDRVSSFVSLVLMGSHISWIFLTADVTGRDHTKFLHYYLCDNVVVGDQVQIKSTRLHTHRPHTQILSYTHTYR